jgi:hypothetical protein
VELQTNVIFYVISQLVCGNSIVEFTIESRVLVNRNAETLGMILTHVHQKNGSLRSASQHVAGEVAGGDKK